ncbi:DUF6612 family protein [Marinilactibacillus sp. GCM10026970]|uniref:DUF6612 family protein n=1 Tax=Marinilactibacillus sp. GCM10026970 TaxID=3252642 RepID=UPI00360F6920
MKSKKMGEMVLFIGGALFLVGCGEPSASQTLDESIDAYNNLESYTQSVDQTVVVENQENSEELNIKIDSTLTIDTYALEQVISDRVTEGNTTIRYVNDVFYLEDPVSGWIELGDEGEELLSDLIEGIVQEDAEKIFFDTAFLETMKEYEDDIEFEEETSHYNMKLILEGEEANNFVASAVMENNVEFETLFSDENMVITTQSIEIDLQMNKETKYLSNQSIKMQGDIEGAADMVISFTQDIQVAYDQYNEVAEIEVPQDAIELSELTGETEEEEGFVDLEEEGAEADLSSQPGVLATGEGSEEGAEDLYISIPPIYQDTPYAGTLSSLENSIPGFNTMTPGGSAMMIWSALATQEEDQWIAWFVVVNRLGMDIKNIDTTFSFENEMGEVLVEDYSIQLSEEEYGVIGNGAIVPFQVMIPEESQEDFMDVLTYIHAWPVVDTFEYEVME